MGRPKKWYLAEQSEVNSEIFLFNHDDSRMKLPDSNELLGHVLDETLPKKGKYPNEGVIVSNYMYLSQHISYPSIFCAFVLIGNPHSKAY